MDIDIYQSMFVNIYTMQAIQKSPPRFFFLWEVGQLQESECYYILLNIDLIIYYTIPLY